MDSSEIPVREGRPCSESSPPSPEVAKWQQQLCCAVTEGPFWLTGDRGTNRPGSAWSPQCSLGQLWGAETTGGGKTHSSLTVRGCLEPAVPSVPHTSENEPELLQGQLRRLKIEHWLSSHAQPRVKGRLNHLLAGRPGVGPSSLCLSSLSFNGSGHSIYPTGLLLGVNEITHGNDACIRY